MNIDTRTTHNIVIGLDDNSKVKSVIVTEDNFREKLLMPLVDAIRNDSPFNELIPDLSAGKLLSESIILNNIISFKNYDNVLVIPSFEDNKYDNILDYDDIISPNISTNSWPIVNKTFDCDPTVFVAFPSDQVNFMKIILRQFGCHVIESNKMYQMGDESYSINVPDGVKFDAILLAGIDINSDETFQSSDIKNDFASYCSPEFDLLDIYADHEGVTKKIHTGEEWSEEKTRLTGERKNIDDIVEYVSNNSLRKDLYNDTITRDRILPIMAKAMKTRIRIY